VKAEAALAQIEEAVNPTPESAIVALARNAKAEVPCLLDAAKVVCNSFQKKKEKKKKS